jgi:hypothetical protein
MHRGELRLHLVYRERCSAATLRMLGF